MNGLIFGRRLYADNYGLDITNNELALIYAIISTEEIPPEDAMEIFGVRPKQKKSEPSKNAKYKAVGQAVYVLDAICGVQRKDIAKYLRISASTVRDSLHYIGYHKDRRCRA